MNAGGRGTLRVLTGCTAVGKTELALAWAERAGAEIVSCDSLLFYRGLDIGTAKPTAAERARVPHHLIDVCEVAEQMNVSRYVTLARAAVEEIERRGKRVLVTGGSGFYLKAFFSAVNDDVAVPSEIRERVATMTEAEAQDALRRLNPAGLGGLDVANPRRVARALERCLATGRTVAELAAAFRAQPGPFAPWRVELVQLTREPADLEARIARRVEAMLAAGLVAEVRALRAKGLEQNASAARAIGYRETLDYLESEKPDERVLAEAVAKNTRALVKKQRTWFRTQLPAHRAVRADEARVETLFDE
ncbi:tRNA (adenosine(37)-N6)-dimethylallyltransferase MiaA [Horticoccus luteus]|uniref:tRNA dimethylallyltransferase n=1 Tax=Horticoccus luteus TaxID=2862869 RepID=A0A8F9XH89_9BACT|nr:tRNA (adenosine(37)-N6)-dimethylallyltransferase MiaA [Horticoccus luteus]QYM80032.1 tRNA (adenosine(37)-N6)-dimethylallyltransferase MiaA [Horticoccus luteus]